MLRTAIDDTHSSPDRGHLHFARKPSLQKLT